MAEISISLATLFEKTFGYKTKAFDPKFDDVKGYSELARVEQGAQGSPYYANDALGREYFMPVTLVYDDGGSNGLQKYDLPFPVVSITSRKTIVETPLTERRGTVKEIININDYEIVVRGFIICATNEFPENEVTQLRTVYEQNTTLSIQCPLTDIFLLRPDRKGSDQLVIYELEFPAVSGVKNVRPYVLRMVSDESFSLVEI